MKKKNLLTAFLLVLLLLPLLGTGFVATVGALARVLVQSEKMVYVLGDSSVYASIEASLVQYVKDAEASGFSVSVFSRVWGTPEETRSFLQQEFSSSLAGCLLVGDIPEAWYEIYGTEGYEMFPTDMYYMDLDGNWTDSDADGIYDGHKGNVAPEIWVGRLKASTIQGDEAFLLNNYFGKNHRYRIGAHSVPQRALVYVDDDWESGADWHETIVRKVYNETTLVKDPATTIPEDYKNRLAQGYEWVHLSCHGWPGGHTFKIPVDQWDGSVYSQDYLSLDPPVLFYWLFVCSASRYTEHNYLGGAMIFAVTGGLLAIGSTKVSGTMYASDFYGYLAEGFNVGDAFKEILIKYGDLGWTILGDPLLKPLMSPPDKTPPNIMDVSQTPPTSNVLPENEVRINATITDDLSGVNQVTLNYTNGNGTWISVNMTELEGNVWKGTIPKFPYATEITYRLIAKDNVDNTITTQDLGHTYQYTVIPEFPSFLLPLFITTTLLTAVYVKKRKKQQTTLQ